MRTCSIPNGMRTFRNDAVVHPLHELRSHLRAFERLEPGAVKVASPVLRGGGGGDAIPLPDMRLARAVMETLRDDQSRQARFCSCGLPFRGGGIYIAVG